MKRSLPFVIMALLAVAAILLWQLSQSPDAAADAGSEAASPAVPASAPDTAANAEGPAAAAELSGEASRVNVPEPAAESAQATRAAATRAAIRLQLVNADGQPLAEVSAELNYGTGIPGMPHGMRLGDGPEPAPEEREWPAARDGRVHIEGVQPGKPVELVLAGPHWARREFRVAPLDPGEVRDLKRITLTPGSLVTGLVLDPDGKPVAGAEAGLRVGAADAPGSPHFVIAGMQNDSAHFTATTDANGRFEIHGVPPDRYSAFAKKLGFVETRREGIDLKTKSGDTHLELRLSRGLEVNGRVLDENGQPVPDARVVHLGTGGFATFGWGRAEIMKKGVATQADGGFTLPGLAADEPLRVGAAAPGFSREFSEPLEVGQEVELILKPAVSVTGFVKTASGQPVADATVQLMDLASAGGMAMELGDLASTDELGAFRFENQASGEYRLKVTSWAGAVEEIPSVQVEPGMEPLEVILRGENPVVVLVRDAEGEPVSGARVIVQASGGQPPPSGMRRTVRIENGELIDERGNLQVRSRTDGEGRARFFSLPVGEYAAEVRAEGFARAQQDFERPSEAEQVVEMELPAAGALRVLVTDTLGVPVPRAGVRLVPDGDQVAPTPGQQDADDQGLAVWRDLLPGRYHAAPADKDNAAFFVDFSDDSNPPKAEPEPMPASAVAVEVVGGKQSTANLVLAEKAVVRVLVTRGGQPVTGAEVSMEASSDSGMSRLDFGGPGGDATRTDATGWAQLPPADPGDYTISTRSSAQNPMTEKDVLVLSGRQEFTVELPPGTVRGIVYGLEGPLAGAQMKLVPATEGEGGDSPHVGAIMIVAEVDDGESDGGVETLMMDVGETSARSGQDGSYVFNEVPAGTWVVKAQAEGYSPWQSESISHDGKTEQDLGATTLEASGSVLGTIRGWTPGETPESRHLLIYIQDEEGQTVDMGVVNPRGEYSFKDLRPGKYRLQVNLSLGGSESRTSELFEVIQGPPTRFDFSIS